MASSDPHAATSSRRLGVVEEAELVTAAVADLQDHHPDATVARVEIIDLKSIEARDITCDRCGAPIPVAYFISLCDGCIDGIVAAKKAVPDA